MLIKRTIIHWIVLWQLSLLLLSCAGNRRLTKDAYLNGFDDGKPFTSLSGGTSSHSQQMKIYLIRHAKPNVEKKKICTSQMAQSYVNAYARAPIIPFDSSLVVFNLPSQQTIYCSNLRRAHETAIAIFGNEFEIVADSQFREFETSIIARQSVFSLPLIIWQTLSRATWVLGLNQANIESYQQARKRAEQVALRLALKANEQQIVVLVAHGMLNRSVAKVLKSKGWQIAQNKGHVNIGATVLEKEAE